MPEGDVKECFEKLLGLLDFLRTEFLRVISEHGLRREDITTALAGLAVGATDSLSAAILALSNYDLSCNGVMVRRFEEHFALMFYFACCDDGVMLSKWFKNPGMVLTERNHKIRTAVDSKMANFFKRNPDWSFKDRFRTESVESVHATWASVTHSIAWASGRYGLQTPEAHSVSPLADELRRGQAVIALATLGPSVSRFIEFLQKFVFTRPEFAQVSPGDEYLAGLDQNILRWWHMAGQLLGEVEEGKDQTPHSNSVERHETSDGNITRADSAVHTGAGESAEFHSDTDRLDWLIQEVQEKVKACEELRVSPDLMEAFIVTSTWLNNAVTHASAILLLITQGMSEAVGPAQRALWDSWIDWRFLLRHGGLAFNAAKVRMSAMLDVYESIEKRPEAVDRSELAECKLRLQEFEAQYPKASAEVRIQREKGSRHWSGMNHSEMLQTLGDNEYPYQFLSWEAEGVMGSIRDVSFQLNDGVARFHFGRQGSESDANRWAFMSGGVLFYMFNDFARLWGIKLVELPDPRENEAGS